MILGLESLSEAGLESLSFAQWSKMREATEMPEMIQLFLFHFCSIGKYLLAMAASIPASREGSPGRGALSVATYPKMKVHSWNCAQGQAAGRWLLPSSGHWLARSCWGQPVLPRAAGQSHGVQRGDVSFILREVEQVELNPGIRCGAAPAAPRGRDLDLQWGLCSSTRLL